MPLKFLRRQASKKASKLKLDSTTPNTSSGSNQNCEDGDEGDMLRVGSKLDQTKEGVPLRSLQHSLSNKRPQRKKPLQHHPPEDTTTSSTTQHSHTSSSYYPSQASLPLDLSLDEVIQEAIAKEGKKTNQRYLQRSTASSKSIAARESTTTEKPADEPPKQRSFRKYPSVARLPPEEPKSRSVRNRLKRSDSAEYRDFLVSELQRMGLKKGSDDDEEEPYHSSSVHRSKRNDSLRHLQTHRYPYASYGYTTSQTPPPQQRAIHPGSVSSFHMKEKPSQLKTIEIAPGVSKPLRGAAETSEAITAGYYVKLSCMVCQNPLSCIADCEMVLCPDCMVVSPNTHEYGPYGVLDGKEGVGLGLVAE